MDRNMDWPWSWEEEVEWKADLEERDYDFLQELVDNAMEDTTPSSGYTLGPVTEELTDDVTPERYVVTA